MGDDENAAVYTERYVAFIDILGFSDIVRRSVQNIAQASRLAGILNKIANRTDPPGIELGPGNDFRVQSFSDCIVLSERASDEGLRHLLDVLTFLTLDLMATGVLVRGGIAKGPLYHTDGIVFGPALLDAYALESTIARYPRILIDRKVHVDFQRIIAFDSSHRRNKVRLADDGPPFLHIFEPFNRMVPDSPPWLQETMGRCHSSIQIQLYHSIYDPRIFEKLRWLALYWNGSALPPVRLPTM